MGTVKATLAGVLSAAALVVAVTVGCGHIAARDPSVPYSQLLDECVRRTFVADDGLPPAGDNGLHYEAVRGQGDILLPQLRKMADGPFEEYGPASDLYFDYLLPECSPGARATILQTLIRKYPRVVHLKASLLATGDAAEFRQLVECLKTGYAEFWNTAAFMSNMAGQVRQAMLRDPKLQAHIARYLGGLRDTPEYLRYYKLYMLFEPEPVAANYERMHRENQSIIERCVDQKDKWHPELRTALGNICVLKKIADSSSLDELAYILRSGNPHLQLQALTCDTVLPDSQKPRFFEIVEELTHSSYECAYGCIGWNLSSRACQTLLAIDPKKSRNRLLALLDSPDEKPITAAAYALVGHKPPLASLAELKQHLGTTRNRAHLQGVIDSISTRYLGPTALARRATQGLCEASQFAGLDRHLLVECLREGDSSVHVAVLDFLRNGKERYTRPSPTASHWRARYDTFKSANRQCGPIWRRHAAPVSPRVAPPAVRRRYTGADCLYDALYVSKCRSASEKGDAVGLGACRNTS